MLRHGLTQSNVTRLGLVERVLSSSFTSVTCLVFLFINGVMMFILRSKPVFQETSRYILLFHLLLADTLQMAITQALYLLNAYRIIMTYPECGVLTMIGHLTNDISPLLLVVMSLERYVAVCHPLRHASIVTVKNTGAAVLAVWIFSLLNVLTRVLLLLKFPFDELESLQMPELCASTNMILLPVFDHYRTAYTGFLFTLAGLIIVCSYVSVMVAARSASRGQGDKESARKAQRTLLLHLVQLALILLSYIYTTVLIFLYTVTSRIIFLRMQSFMFVCFFFIPRCMGSLIYGLRDQTIRVVLTYYLCCTLKVAVAPVKAVLVS
ncbi:odorant receptor 131-2-like [Dunckerocampus dactyliophorus]|uniref:odorant receptor 131-2-like n=1 Tax=Dunckerocampus dactyliophorus TaxID=161453 RepID=UPI00240499ED|nr:odorant receptor 131-2-like [Dunckerocampus dactyliophorus]